MVEWKAGKRGREWQKLNSVCSDSIRDWEGTVGMIMPLCGLKLLEYLWYIKVIVL
jgi:hypothetical protein